MSQNSPIINGFKMPVYFQWMQNGVSGRRGLPALSLVGVADKEREGGNVTSRDLAVVRGLVWAQALKQFPVTLKESAAVC